MNERAECASGRTCSADASRSARARARVYTRRDYAQLTFINTCFSRDCIYIFVKRIYDIYNLCAISVIIMNFSCFRVTLLIIRLRVIRRAPDN